MIRSSLSVALALTVTSTVQVGLAQSAHASCDGPRFVGATAGTVGPGATDWWQTPTAGFTRIAMISAETSISDSEATLTVYSEGCSLLCTTSGSNPSGYTDLGGSLQWCDVTSGGQLNVKVTNQSPSAGTTNAYILAAVSLDVPDVSVAPGCRDGIDNDLDGRIDYPADQGCTSPDDPTEFGLVATAPCNDGVDNDLDGHVDYPNDPDCDGPDDVTESSVPSPTCAGGSVCASVDQGPIVLSHTVMVPTTETAPVPGVRVAGTVDIYRFNLPTGGSATVPCVTLTVGTSNANPCQSAGGSFVTRVATLYDSSVDLLTAGLGTPLPVATVKVCEATITFTVAAVGVEDIPGYTIC